MRSPTISTTRSSPSACAAIGADSTVTCALGERRHVHAVGAGGADAAQRAVVAEDDRPAHAGQPAHRLAEPVVERVRAGHVGLGLREHGDEQLERLDAELGAAVAGRAPACSRATRRQAAWALGHQPEAKRLLGRQVDQPPLVAARAPALHRGIVALQRGRPLDVVAAQADRAGQRAVTSAAGSSGRKRATSASWVMRPRIDRRRPAGSVGQPPASWTTPRRGGSGRHVERQAHRYVTRSSGRSGACPSGCGSRSPAAAPGSRAAARS